MRRATPEITPPSSSLSPGSSRGASSNRSRLAGCRIWDGLVVDKVKRDLGPDVAILSQDIQHALGEGFSSAGRMAAQVAALFVAGGALSSLMLPNTKRKPAGAEGEMVVAAH